MPSNTTSIRAFIALDLPLWLKEMLKRYSIDLGAYTGVDFQNFHVTLLFLGEVDEEYLQKLQEGLGAAMRMQPKLTVAISSFGQVRDMLWAEVDENPALDSLYAEVLKTCQLVLPVGDPVRTFRPHVKIGHTESTPRGAARKIEPLKFIAKDISLFRTIFLKSGGVEYIELKRFPLQTPS